MSHECEDCGRKFDTLSRLRLHDCAGKPMGEDTEAASPSSETGDDIAHVEAEYDTVIGDLPALVDDAREGDVSVLYQALPEYERSLDTAKEDVSSTRSEAYNDILWAYYEPLAEGLDTAAQSEGWSLLTELISAYDPRTEGELPVVTLVIANAVGRALVRTRLTADVEDVPAEALAYMAVIPEYTDDTMYHEESYTYGWGIGHSEHSVGDRLHARADTHHKWTRVALSTSFYADQHAAVDALEQIVTDESLEPVERLTYEVSGAHFYLGCAAHPELPALGPHVPPFWDWEAELDYRFEWDPDVKDRIHALVYETGVDKELAADWTLADLDPSGLSALDGL